MFYYLAGKGIFTYGWIYNNAFAYLFFPLSILPYDISYLVWYGILVLSWYNIVKRLGIVFTFLSVYPALLALETSNVTLVLAALCLNPIGAILAACIKPYLGIFVLLHAACIYKLGTKYDFTKKPSLVSARRVY